MARLITDKWHPNEAPSHTKKANTSEKRKKWAKIANAALQTYKGDEGKAVATANAALADRFWDGDTFLTEAFRKADERRRRKVQNRDPQGRESGTSEIEDSDYAVPFAHAVYDKDWTAEQRQEAAAKGHAMPAGGYPITDRLDLRKAASPKSLARARDRDATIRFIRKRAKALDATDLLPDFGDGGKVDTNPDRHRPRIHEVLDNKPDPVLNRPRIRERDAGEWNEGIHPRNPSGPGGGQFTGGGAGGGSSGASSRRGAAAPARSGGGGAARSEGSGAWQTRLGYHSFEAGKVGQQTREPVYQQHSSAVGAMRSLSKTIKQYTANPAGGPQTFHVVSPEGAHYSLHEAYEKHFGEKPTKTATGHTYPRLQGRGSAEPNAADKKNAEANATHPVLEQWYRQNPDDAREHDVEDIQSRFASSGVSAEHAQRMFEHIQRGGTPAYFHPGDEEGRQHNAKVDTIRNDLVSRGENPKEVENYLSEATDAEDAEALHSTAPDARHEDFKLWKKNGVGDSQRTRDDDEDDEDDRNRIKCTNCGGSGELANGDDCPECEGTGWVDPDEDDDESDDEAMNDSIARMTGMSKLSFVDAIDLKDAGIRLTKDGYLAAVPCTARTGIQVYSGEECGRSDLEVVRVYRPADEVFSKAALKSYTHKPVTLDHPSVDVNSENWKEFAVGQVGDEILRDGERFRVPMMLMDKAAVDAVHRGTRQLSWGYDCVMDWTPGVTQDGQPYDAVQRRLRANHLAVVPLARGGSSLRIGDSDRSSAEEENNSMQTKRLTIDGVDFDLEVQAANFVQRMQRDHQLRLDELNTQLDAAKKTAKEKADEEEDREEEDKAKDALLKKKDADLAAAAEEIKNRDAKIVTLEKTVKDLQDATAPQALDKLVIERVGVVEKSRRIMGDKLVVDGKTIADIRKQVVLAKVGDTAGNWSDAQIEAAFSTIQAPPRPGVIERGAGGSRHIDTAVQMFGRPGNGYQRVEDVRDKAYDAYDSDLTDAWKGPQHQLQERGRDRDRD